MSVHDLPGVSQNSRRSLGRHNFREHLNNLNQTVDQGQELLQLTDNLIVTIRNLTGFLQNQQKTKEHLEDELLDLRINIASLQTEKSGKLLAVNQLNDEIAQLTREQLNLNVRLENMQSEIDQATRELTQKEQTLATTTLKSEGLVSDLKKELSGQIQNVSDMFLSDLKKMVKELDDQEVHRECSICTFKKDEWVAFLPCGHIVCYSCSLQLYNCHQCRANITDFLKIHL